MKENTFDVKKAIQEQVELLLDCRCADECALIRDKINMLIAVYSCGIFSSAFDSSDTSDL